MTDFARDETRIMQGLLVGSLVLLLGGALGAGEEHDRHNVLFVISDDLTATALGCYGNKTCRTPHIDELASQGTLFTRAYCQATFCGPSRASMMFGYYPHATKSFGYVSGREAVGPNRDSWPQHFRKNGYHAARVSKVFHMGVPTDIAKGSDGADDPASWDERFNSRGPEAGAPGTGETLQDNPDGTKKVAGGNRFVVVEADGDGRVHSDGRTAQTAVNLIREYRKRKNPFFLAVGFVRPHVPFVAPRRYFEPLASDRMVLPPKIPGDLNDIPKTAGNRRTTASYQMNLDQQRKLVRGYYASVAYIDAMLGEVLAALEETGQRKNTIVVFTSDHGYHLGEHDLWSKVSLHEEVARVPLIISVPGHEPAVCRSFVELIDLYPTTASLCGLSIPKHIQGEDVSEMLTDPAARVRDSAWCNGKGTLYRDNRWAYISYGKHGEELYDMQSDPKQYENLARDPGHAKVLELIRSRFAARMMEALDHDLDDSESRARP